MEEERRREWDDERENPKKQKWGMKVFLILMSKPFDPHSISTGYGELLFCFPQNLRLLLVFGWNMV